MTGKNVQGDSRTFPVLSLIKVNDINVMNCLIDHLKIETVLITDDTNQAFKITSRKENVPANLSRVIITEPYRECYPAPLFRSYMKTKGPNKILQPNTEDRDA